jgi:hypothetical protein
MVRDFGQSPRVIVNISLDTIDTSAEQDTIRMHFTSRHAVLERSKCRSLPSLRNKLMQVQTTTMAYTQTLARLVSLNSALTCPCGPRGAKERPGRSQLVLFLFVHFLLPSIQSLFFLQSLVRRLSCRGIITLFTLFHHLLLASQGHHLRHLQNVAHFFSDYYN